MSIITSDISGDLPYLMSASPMFPALAAIQDLGHEGGGSSRFNNRTRKQLNPFAKALIDHLEGRLYGGLSQFEYFSENLEEWRKCLAGKMPNYYPVRDDKSLIRTFSGISAKLIREDLARQKKDGITLVSRGPGTEFLAKEGALLEAFHTAGIKVNKIILLDTALDALRQSADDARTLIKRINSADTKIETYEADIFDSRTSDLYEVDGLEVGTCFGLTPGNGPGNVDAISPPISAVKNHVAAFRGQQEDGSHMIMSFDHNDKKKQLESMFIGRAEMAKNMLRHYLGWGDDILDKIEVTFKYGENSQTLSQGYHFIDDVECELDGKRRIPKGHTIWFNNSIKLSEELTVAAIEDVEYYYPLREKALREVINGNLGYHHTVATPKLAA